jgi:hypothetical protein
MSWGAVIIGGGALLGGLAASDAQRSAGNKAGDAQVRAAQLGIDETKRQFDAIQKLLSSFVTGGTAAFGAQGDLAGLNGADKQAAAIAAIQGSPQFGALTKQGEDAILSNASATGGLRGGNTQGALAQFRPALLSGLIDQQYGRLGGLASVGQNAAAGVGNAGMHSGDMISQLLQQQGAARAGAALSGGAANVGAINAFGQGLGAYMGYGYGGSGSNTQFTGAPGYTSVDWGF